MSLHLQKQMESGAVPKLYNPFRWRNFTRKEKKGLWFLAESPIWIECFGGNWREKVQKWNFVDWLFPFLTIDLGEKELSLSYLAIQRSS